MLIAIFPLGSEQPTFWVKRHRPYEISVYRPCIRFRIAFPNCVVKAAADLRWRAVPVVLEALADIVVLLLENDAHLIEMVKAAAIVIFACGQTCRATLQRGLVLARKLE